jgi:hypothetical protein
VFRGVFGGRLLGFPRKHAVPDGWRRRRQAPDLRFKQEMLQ